MKTDDIKVGLYILCFLFLGACNSKETVTSSYYTYKTECLGAGLERFPNTSGMGFRKKQKGCHRTSEEKCYTRYPLYRNTKRSIGMFCQTISSGSKCRRKVRKLFQCILS